MDTSPSLSARAGLLALALTLSTAAGLPAQPREARARAAAALDSLVRPAVEQGRAAGVSVLLLRGRDTLVARTWGMADVARREPLGPRTVFPFASITKQFTAAAVLTLVDAGRVALDAPITTYLPDAPVRGRVVTVRQLLAHTSGVPDFTEVPQRIPEEQLARSPDSLLALVRDEPFYFPPGEYMRYSNSGYVLLGQLIERVGGLPYPEYVERRVLRPAGLTSTRFCDAPSFGARLATGYRPTDRGLEPERRLSPHIPWAAGGFCGTASDLVQWSRAMHARRGRGVISSQAYEEMIRPGTVTGGRRTRYGLGVALNELADRPARQHGGDMRGFTAFTAYLPADSLTVAVLINTQGPLRPDALAASAVRAALGPVARPETPVAADVLAAIAGTYGDARFTLVTDSVSRAPVMELRRGPLPMVRLRVVDSGPAGVTLSDGRARYTFEPARADSLTGELRSPAVWADLGVALVRQRRRAVPAS